MDSPLKYIEFISEHSIPLHALLLLVGLAILRRIKSITIRFGDDQDR
jgi:hypothetical protein